MKPTNNTTKENTMEVYCVVYDYFEDFDNIQLFTDKAKAEALVTAMLEGSLVRFLENPLGDSGCSVIEKGAV